MIAVTHDGVFHADDVFAAATLRLAMQWRIEIERTRDPKRISAARIVFDVGEGSYDHHQRGGNGARDNGIPYASFGLIWRDHGNEAILTAMYMTHASADAAWFFTVADEVDRILVQPIDAADNGVSLHDGSPAFDGVRAATVSSLIAWMNPGYSDDDTPAAYDAAFRRAVELAEKVLRNAIRYAAGVVDARDAMRSAIEATTDRVIVLDRYVPDWQQQATESNALYIVYPSAGTWRCQCVPIAYGKPGVRRALPEAWGGLSGNALQAVTGVPDATFAHRGLFIAGAQSKDGALALAHLAAKEQS